MKKTVLMCSLLLGASSCAHAGTLSFKFSAPGFDNGAVCPASADTIQATNPVDALMSWAGPKSGSDSLLTIPRLVQQTYSVNGMPPGAYSVTIILRDAGGSCGSATKVFIVKGPPAKAVIQ